MSDLISRQAAIDALCNDYCGGHQDCKYYPNCENLRSVQKLPSAQPEIVRCKDCGHRDDHGCCKYWKGLAMGETPIATDDYDFCNHARRREREH